MAPYKLSYYYYYLLVIGALKMLSDDDDDDDGALPEPWSQSARKIRSYYHSVNHKSTPTQSSNRRRL